MLFSSLSASDPLVSSDQPELPLVEDVESAASGLPECFVFIENIDSFAEIEDLAPVGKGCLLYTSPSPRDATLSRMPSSA